MQIAITGAGGLIGRALCEHLRSDGHRIVQLVRDESEAVDADHCWWDPDSGIRQLDKLHGTEAVVHLAGRNISEHRWTEHEKELIRSSRVDATERLCRDLRKLPAPPAVFLSASAIGIYGDCGDSIVTEEHPPGSDFLAQTCVAWEAAAAGLETAGVRVVHTRFAMVLSPDGGALAKVLPLFRRGLAGNLGSGDQYWSWILLEDVVRGIAWLLANEIAAGSFNFAAPEPVTNAEFTRTLASALHRRPFFSVPEFALRLMTGELADAVLLSSCRAVPARLTAMGFEFSASTLREAFQRLL
ncbi:MAG: TIGR01777 family oxidoreductase [Aureliella sp.]